MKDLRPAAQFDSDLDVLLHSNINAVSEQLVFQVCKKVNPLVNSLHDILISSAQLPVDNGILRPVLHLSGTQAHVSRHTAFQVQMPGAF